MRTRIDWRACLFVSVVVTLAPWGGRADPHTAPTQANQAYRVFGDRNTYRCLALAHDQRILAAGDMSGGIHFFDISSGTEVRRVSDPIGLAVVALVYLPNTGLLASQHCGVVHFWDAKTGKHVGNLAGANLELQSLAAAPDGKLAATWLNKDKLTIWADWTDKQPRDVQLATPVQKVQFTPESKHILAGGWEGPIQVVDVARGSVERTFGAGQLKSIAISPDGKTLATFGASRQLFSSGDVAHLVLAIDRGIRLWDWRTGKEMCEMAAAPPACHGMRFANDGRSLLVEHDDGWRVWEVSTGTVKAFMPCVGQAAFASNSRLAFCVGDHGAAVLDLTGHGKGGQLPAEQLDPKQLNVLWNQLTDIAEGHPAVWRLAAGGDNAARFLGQKLRDIPRPDHKRITLLIADLDSNAYQTRQTASAELMRFGAFAQEQMQLALGNNPPLEARLRMEALLAKLSERLFSKEQVLAIRAVEALEQCGTKAAKQVLQELAKDEWRLLAVSAKDALTRLR